MTEKSYYTDIVDCDGATFFSNIDIFFFIFQ